MSAAVEGRHPAAGDASPPLAPLGRRLLSLIYETLLVAALLWCAGLLLSVLERETSWSHWRILWQLCLAALLGLYFVWQWTHGGQTLPMKTWRLSVVKRGGEPVDVRTALLRYLAALAGTLAVGAGFAWALLDRDRQFLHDRIAGTRIVRL